MGRKLSPGTAVSGHERGECNRQCHEKNLRGENEVDYDFDSDYARSFFLKLQHRYVT